MKNFIRLLCALLALLMLFTCLVACGGTKETETETESEQTSTVETETDNTRYDDWGRVYIEDTVPTDLSFKDAADNTVTFLCRDNSTYWKLEMDVDELIDETVNDAIYYRNVAVEERLGVVIDAIYQAGDYNDMPTWNQTVRNSVLNRTHDFDSAAIYASQGSALATEGIYYDVNKIEYLDLEKPWWNFALLEEASLFDALYFLGGDIAISQVSRASLIAYNKKLAEENLGGVNLYELVDSHEWTIDKLYELSSTLWDDNNNSGVIDDGDTVGFLGISGEGVGSMDVWVPAMGITITTKNSDGIPELTMYSPRSISAFEKVHRLYKQNAGGLDGNTEKTTFVNGNVMFTKTMLEGCEGFRDMTDSYGVLPLPMFDEDQGAYYNVPNNTCSLIVVLSDCETTELVGATLELMAAESYRQVTPKYYEICLKSKYSEGVDDARMYDLILSGIRFDFGFIYSTVSINYVGALFRILDRDFAATYESRSESYETLLGQLIDKLEAVAYMTP